MNRKHKYSLVGLPSMILKCKKYIFKVNIIDINMKLLPSGNYESSKRYWNTFGDTFPKSTHLVNAEVQTTYSV